MSDLTASRRIAVVGGGASGALVAVNLLRTLPRENTEVVLVDRTGRFGAGVAYSTTNPDLRLNVAAVRMGAIDGQPGHFFEWLKRREPQASPNDFAPRGIFGEYLCQLLDEAERDSSASTSVRLRKVKGEIDSIVVTPTGLTVSGPDVSFECDHAVLAIGPLPSGDPVSIPEQIRENGRYIENAWDERDIERARGADSVLIIGSGLTMVDAAIALAGDSRQSTSVRVISRNGMVPVPHRHDFAAIDPPVLPDDGVISMADATGLFLEARQRATAAGGDWRDAMDSMRPITPELWRRMSLADRRWFLRNLQRVWETHRFRMAPEIATRFGGLVRSGKVEVSAGRIAAIEPVSGGARVSLVTGGGPELVDVNYIVNSTGASGNILDTAAPLLTGLIETGAARPDDLRLGLDVTPAGRAIERDGTESDQISLIGSIRRGAEWESIGITEIRVQAAAIARGLVTR